MTITQYEKNYFKFSLVVVLFWLFCGVGQVKADTATTTLDISVSNASPFDGATTTVSVLQFDQGVNGWIPSSSATVDFGWDTTTTDINGNVDITATSSTPFSVSASKTNFLSSSIINITPQVARAKITIRDGSTLVFSGLVTLLASNASSVNIIPTAGGAAVAVPARSLLSVLETLDAAQSEFAITDLQYYSSYNSFYINCMTVAGEADPLCSLWQYNLNGVYPWDSVDQAKLKNGDIVILYFGNQRQVSLSTNATTIGTSFNATAQKYDLGSSSYVAETGVTIGVTQPNPNDLWTPIEIATSTVDANGQAVFLLNTVGTYNVGIKEDYYSPLTTLTISAPTPSSGGSVILPVSSGGGGSTATVSSPKIDLGKAIDFLIAKQGADGFFGSALQTDWAAIALASANASGAAAQNVKNYLLSDPNPLVGMNPVSDYARRAMALMSLNINPYSGTKTNYVKKIIDLYDGQQFGDAALYNDDIFALIVLNKAGYTVNDEIIQNAVNFIISKQQADGSWAGSDLTAAAIQALKPLSSMDGIASALGKARNFLLNAQGADGGYGNTYTTAWVMQAIAALGEETNSWQKNNKTAESFLTSRQGADGGLEKDSTYETNRIWSTAYAIPAVQGKPWFSIMQNFSKQEIAASPSGLTAEVKLNENKTASSTLENLDIASSSPEVLITASSTEILLQAKTKVVAVKNAVASAEWLAEVAIEANKIISKEVRDFVAEGTKNTAKLGAGERAGVLNSYKSSFGKSPKTQAEWEDVIRISNNQLPLAVNSAAEIKAKMEFRKVYHRDVDIKNSNDQTAINMMIYGLRPTQRDLNSERAGIRIFVGVYKYLPVSALDWDTVRAIAYSGIDI